MSTKPKKRLSDRERQRIATTKARKGENYFHENAVKAGKATPTKFTSESGRYAAKVRWEKYRIAQADKAARKAERLKKKEV